MSLSVTRIPGNVYKGALLRKRGQLLVNTGPLRVLVDHNGRHGDMVDRACGNNEAYIQLRLRQTDAKVLQAIEEALWRLEKGTYGICGKCGEPIASARLNAVPWTRVCIICKEKQNN